MSLRSVVQSKIASSIAKGSALVIVLTMALGLNSNFADASVSLKNGNFFIGYTDIVYPGGFEPKIERVYNSKTPFKGIFGWGWGNEYEVYLQVSADGSVVVHEYGGGAENRFSPKNQNAVELAKAVDNIAEIARKAGLVGTKAQLEGYKQRLTSDATFRNDEWEKFRSQGKLQARVLPAGTQLYSNRFSYQYLTKVAGGYIRASDTGRVEKFNEEGRLARVSDKNKNFIDFHYGKDGRITQLIDNFNRKMFFEFNNQGYLVKIEGVNGKKSTYSYNAIGELTKSVDVDGNVYTYKYDNQGRHNMTEVGYSDKTTMAIAYYGRDKHENVKSVKDRDGTFTEYSYVGAAGDSNHYSVEVNIKSADGKKISDSKYEYFTKRKAGGEEWTSRMITTIDGERTDTTYNEAFGLPVRIQKGSNLTLFEYDSKGHVTKKTTPTEMTELKYDPRASKVNQVTKYAMPSRKLSSWSQFEYDVKGNLVYARNSEKKAVRLAYDGNGRIMTMIDQDKHKIAFKYNENSKPIEISEPGLGTIHVSYTNSGEIKKVESSSGRKIALQVTSAFQNLLDIIRPAGVTLSF